MTGEMRQDGTGLEAMGGGKGGLSLGKGHVQWQALNPNSFLRPNPTKHVHADLCDQFY